MKRQMKNGKKRSMARRVCLLAGVCLLGGAILLMVLWQWNIASAQQQAQAYVHTIRTIIPTPQGAVPQERGDNGMAVLSLDGVDFVGLLEMPRYGAALPVCADWGRISRYPCCLSGSIYDGTMQIGTTSQKGQWDFYREVSLGDALYFTDMEGNRYAYVVSDVRYEEHADQAALQRREAALTLFVKNVYGFEYIIIFCDVSQG